MTTLHSILVLFAALLAVFGESAFGGIRHLFGAQVDLLPALMVYAALQTNLLTVCLLAAFGGLFFDTLSANPLGISMLPLFVPGFVIFLKRDLILRDQLFAQFFLGLAASAAVPLFVVLLLLTGSHIPLLGWGFVWQWIVMSIGGGIAAPVLFRLFGLFDNALNYQRATENSFRPDREIRRGRT